MAESVSYRPIAYIFHPTWLVSYTILLKADVLNFYLTLDFYNQIAQILCQSEEGILSRQLTCSEATVRHAQVVRRHVATGRHLGASARDTVAFLERERCEKCVVVCPCTRLREAHIEHESWQFLTHLPRQLITLLNKPYFSLLCANSVVI